jgi:hypothetical protein
MLDTPDRIVSGPCPLVFSLVAAEADVLASTDFETADDGLRSAAFTFRYDAPDTALLGDGCYTNAWPHEKNQNEEHMHSLARRTQSRGHISLSMAAHGCMLTWIVATSCGCSNFGWETDEIAVALSVRNGHLVGRDQAVRDGVRKYPLHSPSPVLPPPANRRVLAPHVA